MLHVAQERTTVITYPIQWIGTIAITYPIQWIGTIVITYPIQWIGTIMITYPIQWITVKFVTASYRGTRLIKVETIISHKNTSGNNISLPYYPFAAS